MYHSTDQQYKICCIRGLQALNIKDHTNWYTIYMNMYNHLKKIINKNSKGK